MERININFDGQIIKEETGRIEIDMQHSGNIMGLYTMESQKGGPYKKYTPLSSWYQRPGSRCDPEKNGSTNKTFIRENRKD
jgi:hypothetical protein